jgi:hypothetical protein
VTLLKARDFVVGIPVTKAELLRCGGKRGLAAISVTFDASPCVELRIANMDALVFTSHNVTIKPR